MNTYRKTAIMVGVFFILATVLALIGSTLIGSVIDPPNYLTTVSAHGNQMIIGALLELAAAISVVLIPALLFPILKHHHEGLALGYFGFRIIEASTQIVGALRAHSCCSSSVKTMSTPELQLLPLFRLQGLYYSRHGTGPFR